MPGVGSLLLRAQVNPANHVLLCARVRGGACTQRERARKNRVRWEGLETVRVPGRTRASPSIWRREKIGAYMYVCAPFDAFRSGPPACSSVSDVAERALLYRGNRGFLLRLSRASRIYTAVGPFRQAQHLTFVIVILSFFTFFFRSSVVCDELSPNDAILRGTHRDA